MILHILAIIGAGWILCVFGVVLFLWRVCSVKAPTPDQTLAQVLWMKHAHKVADRRSA